LQFALKTMAPLSSSKTTAEPTNRRDQNWLSRLIACVLPNQPAPEHAAIRQSIGAGRLSPLAESTLTAPASTPFGGRYRKIGRRFNPFPQA
jgi:hypothetical protein